MSEVEELQAQLATARARESLLATILEHAPDFLAHITLDGRFLFLNRYAPGFGPGDLENRTIYNFIDQSEHHMIRATIARVAETRTQQSYDSVGAGPHGEPTQYYTRVAPVIENDVVTSVVLIATDVSRLKRAELGYAEAQATLEQVLAATGMGTWWWDLEKNVGGRDARTAHILGIDPDAKPDAGTLSLGLHPDDRKRVHDAFFAATKSGSFGPLEHRIVRTDGSIRWVIGSGRLLRSSAGKRLVGGVLDITERKQLESQLAQAQKLESIGRLAGGIAHDFNNLLTVISSYTELALRALPAESPIRRDLDAVRLAADRSAALTSQLLAFARQQVIEPRVTLLDDIMVRVGELLRRVVGADIEMSVLLDARRPVKIDVNQFEQVLFNLATNARDAMPRGGCLTFHTADIDLDVADVAAHPGAQPGAYVRLRVSDTGEGIEPAHLPHVFDPFFTTKGPGKGTGLGLATCYGIAAQAGGFMTAASTPGKGATFDVYLPRAADEPLRAMPSPAPAHVAGTETVLVAEDEPMVRELVVLTLRDAGYQVLAAANGNEALALIREYGKPIDLLLSDLVMPLLGGQQLAQRMRELQPGLRVLFMSGYSDSLGQDVAAAGIDFLQKPFSPVTLAQRVRQALDRR